MSLALVIGGTRSGKSAHAELIASSSGLPVRYIATADSSDPEMAERIAVHVQRRPAGWDVVEVADELTGALAGADRRCLLLDGLGAWIGSVMHRAGAFASSDEASEEMIARARAVPQPRYRATAPASSRSPGGRLRCGRGRARGRGAAAARRRLAELA